MVSWYNSLSIFCTTGLHAPDAGRIYFELGESGTLSPFRLSRFFFFNFVFQTFSKVSSNFYVKIQIFCCWIYWSLWKWDSCPIQNTTVSRHINALGLSRHLAQCSAGGLVTCVLRCTINVESIYHDFKGQLYWASMEQLASTQLY